MQIRKHYFYIAVLLFLVFLLTACGPTEVQPALDTAEPETEPLPATAVPPASPPPATPTVTLLPPEEPPPGFEREFSTDFSIHTIPFSEILSGGPPKDGIPAIDVPGFVSQQEAEVWLEDREPVIVFAGETEARIYPYQILTWHEIVNDTVDDRPITVTFCPLCNTAIVFEAMVDGQRLDFGTTGRLRYSNLLMYDRQTESWWQQATGEAVIGELTGSQLTLLPASIISWGEARVKFPQAQVLSRETGFSRPYGQNPYVGYDDIDSTPFLFRGETPDQLPAMARVTTVELNGEAVAYSNIVLQEIGVANDIVGGIELAVFWQPGLASALDSGVIAEGEDVGASGVFARAVAGQLLTFRREDGRIIDEQTGTVWNIFGEAIAGELTGETLMPVVKVDHFWFSWAAFRPETRIFQP